MLHFTTATTGGPRSQPSVYAKGRRPSEISSAFVSGVLLALNAKNPAAAAISIPITTKYFFFIVIYILLKMENRK
ncbi:hypothetical protein AUJ67_01650 [Candidatus Desantisbacteria bacterium CG1_02_49_89]|nr:MAG: hypothetical protein AUJ67_01650 [Candidatus Desantisbacteria bacterium CG1_02_49_89]